jgi:Dyp-type peroxidase family
MSVVLDLADIQGNILAPYAKQGYFTGRMILLHVDAAESDETRAENGRRFVAQLLPRVTTALDCDDCVSPAAKAPAVALNLAFTFYGLLALRVPTRTLRGMPDEFIDGMAKRARMLGDDFTGKSWQKAWDTVWQPASDSDVVHILVTLNTHHAAGPDALEQTTQWIETLAAQCGVRVLGGHNPPTDPNQPRYQEMTAIFGPDGLPTPKEHFGFTDGISDPVFEGQYPAAKETDMAIGQGAVDGKGNWRALATGEFLLGYPDEAQEIPGAAMPLAFSRNGTFMAYRKLHERVGSWNSFIDDQAKKFAAVWGIANPVAARETLMAKMAGRWSDGVPISKAKDFAEWETFNKEYPVGSPERERALVAFTYRDDPEGTKCPMTAHTRRVNTRDSLDPWVAVGQENQAAGSVLNNRRRILRRGLPYGSSGPGATDDGEHGIVMLVVCSSLMRQFEFVQQQWIHYGVDARAGNDTCPIVGNHSLGADTPDEEARKRNGPKAKFVVPADPESGLPPYIAEGLPQFVETRGGEYFFVPSLTALRMIGMGTVDPT